MDTKQLAAAERRELADFLETLAPEQWQQPSLCARWTVHDVAAHVISYDELGVGALAGRMARGRFGINGTNAVGVREYARHSPAELIALLRKYAEPRGLVSMFGARPALTDGTIHHQDIRRALGMQREIPAERLRAALGFAIWAPVIPAYRNIRGLHLVADDVGWSHGKGPEVTGPGEAILVAIAGRPDALGELAGPGLPKLERRVRRD